MAEDDANLGEFFTPQKAAAAPAFDLNKAIQIAKKYFWIPLVGLAIGLFLAGAKLSRTAPVYQSTAEIKVERRSSTQAISVGGGMQEDPTTMEDLKTLEHTFLNPALMLLVIKQLDLTNRDNFISAHRPASTVSEGELVGFLMGNSQVSLITDTRLIAISFNHWNPAMDQEVTNALVVAGIRYDKEQRKAAVTENIVYLEDEKTKMEANLRKSEEAQNENTRRIGSVSTDQDINIEAEQLRVLNSQFAEAKFQRLKLESDGEQVKAYQKDPSSLFAIDGIRNVPAVLSLSNEVSKLRGDIAKMSPRYPKTNPLMIQMTAELAEIERALDREVKTAQQGIEVALAGARRNEELLSQAKADQEQRVMHVQETSIQAKVNQRQIDAYREAYEAALRRLNEENSQSRSNPVLLQPVGPAGEAVKIAPVPSKIFLTFAFGGFFVGMGIIFLIMQLDFTFKSVEEAENTLQLTAFASVPKCGTGKEADEQRLTERYGSSRWANFPTLSDEYSPEAEAFRTMRAHIQVASSLKPGGSILVTSSMPGEGKSFCAINLAVAFAQGGQRTLLVDAQLRKPVIEERVFSARGHRGLADFLLGTANFSNVIQTSEVPNLDVVAAGASTRHPSEIFSRHRIADFLGEAGRLYDRVIFDSAALMGMSDTLHFARFFEVVCMVVQANKTSKTSAKRSLELLQRVGVNPSGMIFNFAPVTKGSQSIAAQKLSDSVQTLDFPKSCPGCGKIYHTLEEYLRTTVAPTTSSPDGGDRDTDGSIRLFRTCECGTPVIVSSANRRDTSLAGLRRRQLFGELLDQMAQLGHDRDDVRAKLLLTLKVSRHEVFGEVRNDVSEASKRRRELFGELLDYLVQGGFEREEARDKLLQTIEVWRGGA